MPVPPVPFPAGGRTHLVYEVHVTNYDDAEIRLAGLRVKAGGATWHPSPRRNWNNPRDNRDHCAYGAEVLAAADGRVAAVVDGVPENVAMESEPIVPLNGKTFAGNLAALEIAGGYYG